MVVRDMGGVVLTRKSSTRVDECEPSDPIGRCNMDGVCDKHRGKRKSSTRVDKPSEFDEKDPRATL